MFATIMAAIPASLGTQEFAIFENAERSAPA
jgi:hypothetical protein